MREIYLDNAATMTKFSEAVSAEAGFYKTVNANPLRGLYKKSVQAGTGVEKARRRVLELVSGKNLKTVLAEYTVIFTRGTTEALNLVANGLIRGRDGFGVVPKEAKVAVDIESHHANILPWKQRYKNVVIAKKMDARELFAAELVSLTGVSNVTGEDFTKRIKTVRKTCPKAILGVDGAQMVGHVAIDIKRLGVDFMAFSGHKFGAPMGIGGLIIRKELAEKLRPLLFGGEAVFSVSEEGEPVFAEVPERLEAGTLGVGAIYGLSEAAFLAKKHLSRSSEAVSEMMKKTAARLKKIKGVKVLAANGSILTFQVSGVHPHDVAQILANEGISVRAGWLCAEPYLRYKEWGPVVRASFSEFNTLEEASAFVKAVAGVRKKMGV